MNEELGQVDADLKGFFVEADMDAMMELLKNQSDFDIMEICNYNWNIVSKYYNAQNFELIFRYMKFIAYTCFVIEYAHQNGLIEEEIFQSMMQIYNDIYEMKKQQE